jgi:hypothetical protein
MTFHDWIHGPLGDHDVVFGLSAYWWKRICSALQLLSGLVAVKELLNDKDKIRIEQILEQERSRHLSQLTIRIGSIPINRMGIIFILVSSLCSGILMMIVAGVIMVFEHDQSGSIRERLSADFAALLIVGLSVGSFVALITAIAVALFHFIYWGPLRILNFVVELVVRRVVPTFVSPFVKTPEVFDRSVLIGSLLLFIVSSLFLIVLT